MYYIIGADQKEYGPVSAEELRRWIAAGRANGQTRTRTDNSTEWRPLREYAEFADLANPQPRSAPPTFSSTPPPPPESLGDTNSLAIAGFVCSLLGLACCGCGILSVVGLVLSLIALNRANQSPDQAGRGLAIAGIVLAALGLLGGLGFWGLRLTRMGHMIRPFGW